MVSQVDIRSCSIWPLCSAAKASLPRPCFISHGQRACGSGLHGLRCRLSTVISHLTQRATLLWQATIQILFKRKGPLAAESFYLLIHFWLCWVFCVGFSPAVKSGGYSRVAVLEMRWLLLLQSTGSGACRLQKLQPLGSGAQSQELWHTGIVALRYTGSSWMRDWTELNHNFVLLWTSDEVDHKHSY